MRISQVQIYKHCNSYAFPESGSDMEALYDYSTDSYTYTTFRGVVNS